MVPHDFHRLGGLREGHAVVVALEAVAVLDQLDLAQVGARFLQIGLGQGSAAMAGIDIHAVLGEAGEHRLLTGAEHCLVLGDVVLADGVQRLFGGERVGVVAAGADRRGAGLHAAIPGGDTAVGVGGAFGTHRGERCVEFAGVGLLGLGEGAGGEQCEGERQFSFHDQKLALTVTEAKSRSSMVENWLEPKNSL
ncbi:hypothetical protein D3C81_1469870 [compost metagenome]